MYFSSSLCGGPRGRRIDEVLNKTKAGTFPANHTDDHEENSENKKRKNGHGLYYSSMQEKLRSHIEKIVPLNDEEFALVLSHFSIAEFRKKQFIFENGERVKYAYYVVSGLLKLLYTDSSGNQHIISFAMEDWWESDFCAYFTQTKATMSLQCLEKTTVYCLSLESYQNLCTHIPNMKSFFLQKSNSGNIGSQQRIISLLTANAKERYEQLLERYPSLLQRVSKTQLAAYLGVSRETLSRLYS